LRRSDRKRGGSGHERGEDERHGAVVADRAGVAFGGRCVIILP
jgi:hypothetical protein